MSRLFCSLKYGLKYLAAAAIVSVIGGVSAAQAACHVFEHANYGGWRRTIEGGLRWNYIGDRYNDKVSSIRVDRGCRFIAYEHRDFQGWERTYSADTANVGPQVNDRISSGICRCNVVMEPGRNLNETLTNAMAAVLQANRGRFQLQIAQALGRPDMIARGVSLYDISVGIGTPDVQVRGTSSFTITLRNNSLRFKSTTPTVLGKYADPGFAVTFDAVLNGGIQRSGRTFRVTSAVVNVPRVSIRNTNVQGGVAMVATQVKLFFNGPTARERLRQAIREKLTIDFTERANRLLATLSR